METFSPTVGDVILLKHVFVYGFDGRSLNAYYQTEMVLNPERPDCRALQEWWELKMLEESGGLDDFTDDLDDKQDA